MKEKSKIEKNAEERQISLLSTALGEASKANGYWLKRFWKEVSEAVPARRVGQPVQCTVHGIAFRPERMQYEPVHLVQ